MLISPKLFDPYDSHSHIAPNNGGTKLGVFYMFIDHLIIYYAYYEFLVRWIG